MMKHGELFKIGRKTGKEVSRYFILRDNALFIYKSRDKVFPSQVISLKGMYISTIQNDNRYQRFLNNVNTEHSVKISDDRKMVKPIILNHKNQDII